MASKVLQITTEEVIDRAVKAKSALSNATSEAKNKALNEAARILAEHTDEILEANRKDVEAARGTISDVMIDRLTLTKERIQGMADGILDVVKLDDPVGTILDRVERPNGLVITKVSVPIGVLAIIFESRPNVTSDAAALALKSGNACILRGGKEAINSNIAIAECLREAAKLAGLPEDAVNIVTDTSRQSATELMTARGKVDMLIPRGGAGLIRACVENAKVPCIETGTGICHVYVDEKADLEKALNIVENAKTSRPSVCNAEEVLVVNEKVAGEFLPKLYDRLVVEREKAGKIPVELRLDEKAAKIIAGKQAGPDDFDTEFLDYILAVKIVNSVEEAVAHIQKHSTGHSDAIVTENQSAADYFIASIDSAAVYHNCSTRFTDGGEFGLGCELGISTQKMHARGPMGLREMTTYKYVIRGNGQVR